MNPQQAEALKEFLADNWQRFLNHCDRHELSEEDADRIYEDLESESH